MGIEILGASTLDSFTEAIRGGFGKGAASPFTLVQIHGAPAARHEDERLLIAARELSSAHAYLIHRPDEVLLNRTLRRHFEERPHAKLIFLGDLVFRDEFWKARCGDSMVATHPQLDLSMPEPARRPVVGTFTSWGEMRKLKHYLKLVDELMPFDLFDFKIGGAGLDRELKELGHTILPAIEIVTSPFLAHFNVQLYHLNGKKRFGESSGSLHRGISIPVIFEANGAERLEGLNAVKIHADDDLHWIDYAQASREIVQMTSNDLNVKLAQNLAAGRRNSVREFAERIKQFMHRA